MEEKKILLNKKDKQKNSTGSIISNQKVVETPAKTDVLTHIYVTPHLPGSVHYRQVNNKWQVRNVFINSTDINCLSLYIIYSTSGKMQHHLYS